MQATVEQLADQAHVRGLQLTAEFSDELGPVPADADRLRQVLINLLGNALKFTLAGGVVVRVRAEVDGEPTSLQETSCPPPSLAGGNSFMRWSSTRLR